MRRRPQRHSINRPRSNGRRSGLCATQRFKYLPTSLLYFFYRGLPATRSTPIPTAARPATRSRKRSSRDSSSWWSGMPTQSGGTIDCSGRKWTSASSTIPTSAICKVQLAETGRRLWVLDVTSDLGIPSFVAIAHWMENSQEFIEFGSGAHFDARIAVLRAHDRAQSISVHRSHGRPQPEPIEPRISQTRARIEPPNER